MKALPLWQPWASLVIHGRKRIETRHWSAPTRLIGKRIAIHATKTKAELWVAGTQPFHRVLRELRDEGVNLFDPNDPTELPLGAILGTVVLVCCDRMTDGRITATRELNPDEYAFGLYRPGRYAWTLGDPRPLPRPVPFKGSQGMFDVPNELVGLPPEPTHEQEVLL